MEENIHLCIRMQPSATIEVSRNKYLQVHAGSCLVLILLNYLFEWELVVSFLVYLSEYEKPLPVVVLYA